MKGFLLIDKEKGLSSFDVVRAVRRITGVRKVGHSGTLDPLATGLLLVAIGEGTKLLEFFIGCDKEYVVEAKFGFQSDTYDAEGEIVELNSQKIISEDEIKRVIEENFLGEIDQVPPKYSALKIKGQKAYELARKGQEVKMKARSVKVAAFELLEYRWPFVSFRVECGAGTYIRSLIHDLGVMLGSGAYVQELNRTKLGVFSLKDAVSLQLLDKKVDQAILSPESAVESFNRKDLNEQEWQGLANGKVLPSEKIPEGPVMAFYNGELKGVLENYKDGIKFRKLIL